MKRCVLAFAAGILFSVQLFSQNFVVYVKTHCVQIGSRVPIFVELRDTVGRLVPFTLKARLTQGGFDRPEVVTIGIGTDGSFVLNFLAPRRAGTAKVTLFAETPGQVYRKEIVFEIVEQDEARSTLQTSATIETLKGNVSVKKKGEGVWTGVSVGSKVHEGDELATLGDSYVVIAFPDGSKTYIAPNSQVLFEKLRQTPDGVLLVTLTISKGKIYNVVEKIVTGSSFEVRAGSVTAGVRGTSFGVEFVEYTPVVKVWKGEVFAFYEDTFVIPISEGASVAFPSLVEPLVRYNETMLGDVISSEQSSDEEKEFSDSDAPGESQEQMLWDDDFSFGEVNQGKQSLDGEMSSSYLDEPEGFRSGLFWDDPIMLEDVFQSEQSFDEVMESSDLDELEGFQIDLFWGDPIMLEDVLQTEQSFDEITESIEPDVPKEYQILSQLFEKIKIQPLTEPFPEIEGVFQGK